MRRISVISFDLGSNLGFSKSTFNLDGEFRMEVSAHGTIDLDKLTDDYIRKENPRYSRHRVKMNIFERKVRALCTQMKFNSFVAEDVHYDHLSAYRALLLYMDTLDRIVTNDIGASLNTVTPSLIKKYISGYGGADKIAVQQAILNNPTIILNDKRQLTEHSADSIAGAYAYVQKTFFSSI